MTDAIVRTSQFRDRHIWDIFYSSHSSIESSPDTKLDIPEFPPCVDILRDGLRSVLFWASTNLITHYEISNGNSYPLLAVAVILLAVAVLVQARS